MSIEILNSVGSGDNIKKIASDVLSPFDKIDEIGPTEDNINQMLSVLSKHRSQLDMFSRRVDAEHKEAYEDIKELGGLLERTDAREIPGSSAPNFVGVIVWCLIAIVAYNAYGAVLGTIIAVIPGTVGALGLMFMMGLSDYNRREAKAKEINDKQHITHMKKFEDLAFSKSKNDSDIEHFNLKIDEIEKKIHQKVKEHNDYVLGLSLIHI